MCVYACVDLKEKVARFQKDGGGLRTSEVENIGLLVLVCTCMNFSDRDPKI